MIIGKISRKLELVPLQVGKMCRQIIKIPLLVLFLPLFHGCVAQDCGWDVAARNECPAVGSTEWECLRAKRNCSDESTWQRPNIFCKVYGTGCSQQLMYHCALNSSGVYTEACAASVPCQQGEQSQVPDEEGGTATCIPCQDEDTYMGRGPNSHEVTRCMKKRLCRPEYHEIVCYDAGSTWDRECTCDYTNDYVVDGYNFSVALERHCSRSLNFVCIYSPCPNPGEERVSDFGCRIPCETGLVRDDRDRCVTTSSTTTISTSTTTSTTPDTTTTTTPLPDDESELDITSTELAINTSSETQEEELYLTADGYYPSVSMEILTVAVMGTFISQYVALLGLFSV